MNDRPERPDWHKRAGVATAQEGSFTPKQAAAAGYSPQLLIKHIRAGRISRMRRGIYRLVHFPAVEHEDLIAAWLWSDQAGVISSISTFTGLPGAQSALSATNRSR